MKRPDYSELDRSKEIVFLVSGGRDSSAMVLEAWQFGLNGVMLHGDTGFERISSLEVLDRLAEKTGFELKHIRYDGERVVSEIIEEAFRQVPIAAAKMKEKRAYVRNVFQCCSLLKHGPMNRYVKKNYKDCQLILGLKVGDGAINRGYRMRELQYRKTHYRRLVKTGLLYYYPLRDCQNEDITAILEDFGFGDVKSSGCVKCPIFCLFPKWRKKDPIAWLRSVTYARKLGIEFYGTNQTDLTQFCNG